MHATIDARFTGFQRAGTTTRTAVTTAGEHEFTLHHIKDTAATDDDPCTKIIHDTVTFVSASVHGYCVNTKRWK